MAGLWEDQVSEFADRTRLGRHSHVMVMYSGTEPSLRGLKGDVLRDLDILYSASPGPRYFCGVEVENGLPSVYDDFGEF